MMALLRPFGATIEDGELKGEGGASNCSGSFMAAVLGLLVGIWTGNGDKAVPALSIIGSSDGARIFSSSAARALVKSKSAASGPGT
jgi:hypothetical protein